MPLQPQLYHHDIACPSSSSVQDRCLFSCWKALAKAIDLNAGLGTAVLYHFCKHTSVCYAAVGNTLSYKHTYQCVDCVCAQGLTASGLGIGALAVAWFRGIIPKQSVATYPAAAKAVAQEPVAESEEQKQQRLYEEESEKLASELREFDAQMEAKEKDAYRQKLKKEGLWKE